MITNQELTDLIIEYNSGGLSKSLMIECFVRVAKDICIRFDRFCPDDVIRNAASLCVDKIEKFDGTRGRAINFISTIILCSVRQEMKMLNTKWNSKNT